MSTAVMTESVQEYLLRRASRSGHMGTIEVLAIDELNIDPSYQRDLVQKLVDEIAAAYDPLTAGVVLVSRRKSGKLYIVDGQHKTAGAKQAGNETVMCLVVDGLSAKDEAQLRLAANVKRADTALEKFKAKLVAGDPVATSIVTICTTYGTRVNESPVGHQGINACAALEAIYRTDGTGLLLGKVFQTIQSAWGTPEGDHALASTLKGIGFFIGKHHGEYDEERLVERLMAEGPAALRRIAMNHRIALGGSTWLNYYRAIVEAYNFRLGDASKLEWKTSGWSAMAWGSGGGTWS